MKFEGLEVEKFTRISWRLRLAFMAILLCFSACAEKDFNPDDPAGSFAIARASYDDKNYDYALQKLGEFKSRFPYSKFTALAELYIADSHFELAHYEEAAASYTLFAKLYPKHEKAPYALYRVGESYWVDASDAIDRDQDLTVKAIDEWQNLITRFPDSDYAKKAKAQTEEGYRRVARSQEFIASFYCKMEIWHACAFRSLYLAEKYPQFRDIHKKAVDYAAKSFDELAKQKAADPESDKNIYVKSMNADQLRAKAAELRDLNAKAGS